MCSSSFVFKDTATTEIYTYGHTLSLHDALPISLPRAAHETAQARRPRRPRSPRWHALRRRRQDAHQGSAPHRVQPAHHRSEEHTSELQSLMRISYAVFCLKKKKTTNIIKTYKTLLLPDSISSIAIVLNKP